MPAFVGIATIGVLVPLAVCTVIAYFTGERESATGGAMLTLLWAALTASVLAAYGGI